MKVTVYKHKNTESGALLAWVIPGERLPIAEIYENKPGVFVLYRLDASMWLYHRKICNTKRTAIRNAEEWVRIETPLVNLNYLCAEIEIVSAD